jgi:acyl carrier protein
MNEPLQGDWRSKLQGHPPATVLAYEHFRETGDPKFLDAMVVEILRYFHPEPSSLHLDAFAPEKDLNQDLGLDSVAMVEAVFLMEDLLEISIPNEDLESIRTFGQLQAYLRSKTEDTASDKPSA